jgi:hypothetical protein
MAAKIILALDVERAKTVPVLITFIFMHCKPLNSKNYSVVKAGEIYLWNISS